MQTASINHPHAQTAVLLASFNQPDRDYVNDTLAVSGTPRRLYTLARLLRAAYIMDEINAVPARDAAEHLEIRMAATRRNGKCLSGAAMTPETARALYREFNGDNHADLAARHGLSVAEVYHSLKASGHAARLVKAA